MSVCAEVWFPDSWFWAVAAVGAEEDEGTNSRDKMACRGGRKSKICGEGNGTGAGVADSAPAAVVDFCCSCSGRCGVGAARGVCVVDDGRDERCGRTPIEDWGREIGPGDLDAIVAVDMATMRRNEA